MKSEQGIRVTVIASFLAVLILVGWLTYLLYSPPSAATTYGNRRIETNKLPLCPGEKVSYDQVARIDNAPVALLVVETVWSVEKKRTVIPDRNPAYINIPEPFTGSGHAEWTVPDLPAGHYELRRSTTAQGRQTEMFVVTFEVKKWCK